MDPFLDLLSRSGDISLIGLAGVTVAWAIRRMLSTDTRERSIFDRQRANECEALAATWRSRAITSGWKPKTGGDGPGV